MPVMFGIPSQRRQITPGGNASQWNDSAYVGIVAIGAGSPGGRIWEILEPENGS
jgi:hypothetical protein